MPDSGSDLDHPSGLVDGLAELTLETDHMAELRRFYERTLGLAVLDESADRIWLAVGPRTRLGLWSPGPKEHADRGGRHVHFALSAAPDQLDTLCERLSAARVDVEGPVEHDGGDRSIYFSDPAGNLVEIWDFFQRGDGARRGVDALR